MDQFHKDFVLLFENQVADALIVSPKSHKYQTRAQKY